LVEIALGYSRNLMICSQGLSLTIRPKELLTLLS
jgi:hypothetical protein